MPKVTVKTENGEKIELTASHGINLRKFLLQHDISPYTSITRKVNCGGNGLCATCGVFIEEELLPTHWHDKLARAWNYPRLSCQIAVERDLMIEIPKKKIWGKRRKQAIT